MGAEGMQHGEDYRIADKEKALINPAKALLCMIYELLKDNCHMAYRVKESYIPLYKSKDEYFEAIDRISAAKDLVVYNSDGSVTLDFHNNNFHGANNNS
jgi:hypothetical protein